MTNKKATQFQSVLVDQLYSLISEEKIKIIVNEKKNVMTESGDYIRIMPYIPTKIYIVLAAFGAFGSGESEYVTHSANTWIESKVASMGLLKQLQKAS